MSSPRATHAKATASQSILTRFVCPALYVLLLLLFFEKVLNLNLNPVVWKTILSREVGLSDLDLVDATYYK